VLYMWKKWV